VNLVRNLSNHSQGIFYAIGACFFSSILVALVRFLSHDYHIFFIVLMRNLFSLIFFLPQIVGNYKHVLTTKKLPLHIFRGVNGLIAMMIWFYVVSILPLSETVSISFIGPILITIFAIIFLKEKVKSHIWISSFIGFLGILIILRPGFREFNIAYLYCLVSVTLSGVSNITVKILTKTEKPQTIVTYMSFVILIGSIPFALPHLQAIDFTGLICFALIGLVSNLTHICISHSYARSEVSLLQPFDFTRLIFTAIIAYFAFGEIVDVWVIIGSLVILFGVIIVMPRRSSRNKQKPYVGGV
jgi:drug/metabolite transporter (DMT)-like permease